MTNNREKVCLCAICREMIYEGDVMADCKVFDFEGDLDYIELAHEQCAIDSGDERWEFSEPEQDEPDDFMSDAEADADVLRGAGMGTDEDYGYFGDEGF